jgi:Potato inhibitor I family
MEEVTVKNTNAAAGGSRELPHSRAAAAAAAQQWPDCVGMKGEDAVALIQADHPDFKVLLVSTDAMLTMDMRMDRVRVFVDAAGIVTRVPRVA